MAFAGEFDDDEDFAPPGKRKRGGPPSELIADARTIQGADKAVPLLVAQLKPMTVAKGAASMEVEGDLHVTLFQVAQMGEQEIDSFVFEIGGDKPIETFCSDIVSSAEDDIRALPAGTCRYCIRVRGRSGRCGAFTLKVPKHEEDGEDGDFAETANQRGLTHQLMRHTEIFAHEMVTNHRTDKGLLLDIIKDLRAENATLKRYQFDQVKQVEQLRNMQFERDLKLEELRRSDERKEKALSIVMKAAPVIAAKFMGGGAQMATELGASPVDASIEALVTSLEQKGDKLQALLGVLDPVDQALFFEIYEYANKKRQMRAEAEAQSAPP